MYLPLKISSAEISNLSGVHSSDPTSLSALQEGKDVIQRIEKLLSPYNDVIDGDAIKGNWLPIGHYDVFISHSHNDKGLALKLYQWFNERRISCFVDSIYWNSADKLLKIIDNKYCAYKKDSDGKKTYNYNKRNYSTSLVHALLSMAILKTIDKCDIGIFIDSENSIAIKLKEIGEKTMSPWIYQEINMMVTIKKNEPKGLGGENRRTYNALREGKELKMSFPIPTDKLFNIDAQTLNNLRGKDSGSWLNNLCEKVLSKNSSQVDTNRQLLHD